MENKRWRFVLDSEAEGAEQYIPTQCALVKDIRDTYPELRRPHVSHETIAFTDPKLGKRFTWRTPLSVVKWINCFDRDEHPAPMAVILRARDAVIKDSTKGIIPQGIIVTPDDYNRERQKESREGAHSSRKIRRR